MFLDNRTAEDLIDQILDRINVYKKCVSELTERGIEGYIIQTEQPNHLTISVENVENREYVLERTEYPDIMSEELMYDVLEGTFLDDNFEVLELSPMRWQDWYNERIDKIQETVKALSEYIEKHKY